MVWRDSAEEGQFQRGGGSKDRMNKMWGADLFGEVARVYSVFWPELGGLWD